MTFETSDIVASVVKSVEPDRSLAASQRVAGMAQDQLAAQAAAEAGKFKVDSSDKVEKARFKHEEEQRQRKHAHPQHQHPPIPDGQEHQIDTVA